MSDIIQLLPDSVANQIAAGEVIQRPASMIKELVENSLDAGATRIQVIVTDAGKTAVQVIDNGKGMSETDARLSFERHATSKIRTADDLFALNTMGFRGEALASIAAVAQVELRTRMATEELGVSVQIEGSKFIHQEPIATPVGANFIVRNLFFNVPARRKFLKSNATEMVNITSEFERIALAHPDISLSLATPERTIIDLPAGNFRQRIVNIFGQRLEKVLLPVQVESSLVSVVGFIGTPESSKKKGAHQFFFVNGRYMRHPFFAKAVASAYERLIPEGEQVHFFLQLIVDPGKIDVNIHPTKTEIKFEEEQAIWQIIRAAVREALNKFNAVPTIDFDTEGRPDIPVYDPSMPPPSMPTIDIDASYNPFLSAPPSTKSSSAPASQSRNAQPSFIAMEEWVLEPEATPLDEAATVMPFEFYAEAPSEENQVEQKLYDVLETAEQKTWESSIGNFLQYRGRYLLTPTAEGLLVIDQQRAHTRVLYEEYLVKVQQREFVTQGLLFPQIIEFSPSVAPKVEALEEALSTVGFEISYLGGGSFSILGVPAGFDHHDPIKLVQQIVDDALHKHTSVQDEVHQTIALSMAKKTAMGPGKLLNAEEMRNLVARLYQTSNPSLAPDGLKIMATLPHDTIQQLII